MAAQSAGGTAVTAQRPAGQVAAVQRVWECGNPGASSGARPHRASAAGPRLPPPQRALSAKRMGVGARLRGPCSLYCSQRDAAPAPH